jgi:hypothetical protein
MDTSEKIIYSNTFGTVTDRRIILNHRSGTEDIPIEQISSITFQHKRNYFFAIGSFVAIAILLIPLFVNDYIPGSVTIISISGVLFFILSGISNWIGHHNIVVSLGGQNRKPLKVEMAKTRDGRQFVEAVKKSIFK